VAVWDDVGTFLVELTQTRREKKKEESYYSLLFN